MRGVRLNDATDRSVDEMSEEELNETLAEVSKRKKNNKVGKDGAQRWSA